MKTKELVKVWDQGREWDDGDDATIGVNWSAVGPVMPETARRFARQSLRAADRAEALRAKARKSGCQLLNPETGAKSRVRLGRLLAGGEGNAKGSM